jgi:hypothetical protein
MFAGPVNHHWRGVARAGTAGVGEPLVDVVRAERGQSLALGSEIRRMVERLA